MMHFALSPRVCQKTLIFASSNPAAVAAGSSQCHIKNLSHAEVAFFSSKGGLTMDLG